MTKKISDFMTAIPQSIEPHQTLPLALERMGKVNCTHLPVLSGRKILGILSERDISFARSFKDIDFDSMLVNDVMTEDPYIVPPDAPLSEVAKHMAKEKIGSALVANEKHELVGIFTTTDALHILEKMV